ncbi:hypothetical protein [Geobacter grbiciae]|uniref:hypothetical protein n=1 Tax=Geobacter grbiciae TaxID=155042 RepID=UPI001C02EFD7|nr:hypothetical protein [Geobacter grbiciae]MBT1076771.1 hypothetical protein [Geobacter grbiciae]
MGMMELNKVSPEFPEFLSYTSHQEVHSIMLKWHIRNFILFAATVFALGGCVTPYPQQGASAGAAIGGITGTILDERYPWRGGIVGATIGAIAGATLSEISAQGAREVAYAERPVEYRMEGGGGYYYAEPAGYDERRCKRVREKIYDDGRLIRERINVICDEDNSHYRHRHHHEDDQGEDDDDD